MTDFNDADRTTQIIRLMKVGDQGRQAYNNDRTCRDNPYPPDTALHNQWHTSYLQAFHDDIPNTIKLKNHAV